MLKDKKDKGTDREVKVQIKRQVEKNSFLLSEAAPGRKYQVKTIYGGYGLINRLNAMGILPGEIIKIIHHTGRGPMTLAVKGVRIALGRGITQKIEVTEPDEALSDETLS